jgi:hypothetical protein
MATPPPALPPNDVSRSNARHWISMTITAPSKFLSTAAKEWLPSLLDQPTAPPFEYDASFDNEFSRSSRLTVIVIVITSILLGSLSLFTHGVDVTITVKYAFTIIAVAFLVALVYKPFAFICGVRISPRNEEDLPSVSSRKRLSLHQITFTVLYTFVPWIPIFAFIKASVLKTEGVLQDFLVIAPFLCFLYMMFNFAKAIKLTTNCGWPRIWLSLSLPLAALIIYSATDL